MNKSLFELTANYQRVLDKIDQVDEITPELMDELNAIHESTENKVLAKTSIVKNWEAEISAIEAAIESFDKRLAILTNKAVRMRREIKDSMEKCKLDKAKNAFHEVKIVLNNPRLGDDLVPDLVPMNYWQEKIERKIDRRTLLADLKEGLAIPGASIVQETRLQIR